MAASWPGQRVSLGAERSEVRSMRHCLCKARQLRDAGHAPRMRHPDATPEHHLPSLLPDSTPTPTPLALTRRRVVRAAARGAFAAVVLPVTAQTIRTCSAGLTAAGACIPVRAPGRRAVAWRGLEADGRGRQQGERPAGARRPRRDRRARLCGRQQHGFRRNAATEGIRARPVRTGRCRYPERHGRGDAPGPENRRPSAPRHRLVPRSRPHFPHRLPAQRQQGGGRRPLAALPRAVQGERRRARGLP